MHDIYVLYPVYSSTEALDYYLMHSMFPKNVYALVYVGQALEKGEEGNLIIRLMLSIVRTQRLFSSTFQSLVAKSSTGIPKADWD